MFAIENKDGMEHLQGYFELFTKRRQITLSRQFFGKDFHLESRNGTKREAIKYCEKTRPQDEKPNDEVYYYGHLGNQGRRTDIEHLVRSAEEGVPCGSYMHDNPRNIRYRNHYKGHQLDWIELNAPDARDVSCFIFYGDSATGKTHFVKSWIRKQKLTSYQPQKGKIYFTNYINQKILFLDEFDGSQCPLSELLAICDKWTSHFNVKLSASRATGLWELVYICTNVHPDLWYPQASEDSLKALRRRFNHQYWLFQTNKKPEIKDWK